MNDIPKRVNGIRQWLKENRLDAIIIPHEDEYLSEYIPPENERLAWATGFTGSAGLAIITQDKAAIFIDGRYTVQVKEQVDSSLYTILHISKDPYLKWLKTILNSNAKVGYDSRLQHANWKIYTEKIFAGKITLIPIDKNPIDLLWDDRPSGNMDMAILLDEKYTGKSSIDKRISMAKEVPAIISLEEHTIIGGLGSACAEVLLEENFNEKKFFKRIGIPDVFPSGYGNQKDMMARNGISAPHVVSTAMELLKKY